MRTHLVPCLAILALSLLAIPAGAEPMSAAGPGSTAATSGGAARTTNGNAKAVTRKPTAEPSRPAPVSLEQATDGTGDDSADALAFAMGSDAP